MFWIASRKDVTCWLSELKDAGSTTGDDQHLREEDRMNHAHGARICDTCGDGEGKICRGV